MASIEHGFKDHDSLDCTDWAEYRKFCEEEGESEDTTEEDDYFPTQCDVIDCDWE